ncbi:hypothetical protein BDP27DRAFT_1418639 [Rhodocollybia butyracea]|uniref:Uncharacterized protein n=1 Tax=Rhodocollybia butyracea TaxID=206335 RepID=A0A9P5U9A6_9AGAR|nr:hypothetical protein BDP27DRAFT_1418639 [Rhodocollybia butyracea]
MSSASRMFLALATLSHAVLNILAFSLAIPADPVSNISFPVIWERDSTDPTVFSLGQQLEDSSTGQFSGGGIFANISGTQGQSVSPQAVNLTVNDSGTFVIYGLVIGTATSTFYTSPTFVVLGPAQAASTISVNPAETYLGTSFPLTPTSTTSIPSSPTSTSTSNSLASTPEASPTSSTKSGKSTKNKIGDIIGDVIAGLIALSVLLFLVGFLFSACCRHHW